MAGRISKVPLVTEYFTESPEAPNWTNSHSEQLGDSYMPNESRSNWPRPADTRDLTKQIVEAAQYKDRVSGPKSCYLILAHRPPTVLVLSASDNWHAGVRVGSPPAGRGHNSEHRIRDTPFLSTLESRISVSPKNGMSPTLAPTRTSH